MNKPSSKNQNPAIADSARQATTQPQARHRRSIRKQIMRRRGPATKHLVGYLLDAMLENRRVESHVSPITQGEKACVRFAARIAKRHPDQQTVSAILEALKTPNPELALRGVLDQANQERALRQAAAAHLEPRELRRFLRVLSRGRKDRFGLIKLAKPESVLEQLGESIVAYTDSKEIVLPPTIGTTSSKLLNLHMGNFLTAHESGHIWFGSFAYSGTSRRGRAVKAAFEKIRTVAPESVQRKLRDAWIDYADEELGGQYVESDLIERYVLGGYAALFEATGWPKVCSHLLNALEDGRLVILIKDAWPGLDRIFEIHEHHSSMLYRAPQLASPLQNLLAHLAGYAAKRKFPSIIGAQHQDVLARCCGIIDNHNRLGRRRDVYHSLLTVAKLLEALRPTLESDPDAEELEQMLIPAFQPMAVDLAKLKAALDDGSLPKLHNSFQADDEERAAREPTLFDEIIEDEDGNGLVLAMDVVEVVTRTYEPLAKDRLPVLPALNLPFPYLTQNATRSGRRRFHDDGLHIANNRLAMYFASTKAGNDDYPLMFDRSSGRSQVRVTVLVDLSLSMEARLAKLDGDSPLQRAIQVIKYLANNFHTQGVEFDVIGCHDGGRRPVSLRPLEAGSDTEIESLRSAGFGGFRVGAALRALHERRSQASNEKHHAVLAFTDALGLYVTPGADDALSQLQAICADCSSRKQCNHERSMAMQTSDYAWRSIVQFANDRLVWTDVADAIESTETSFHLFAIDGDVSNRAQLLDQHLAGQWCDASTPAGILRGVAWLAGIQ